MLDRRTTTQLSQGTLQVDGEKSGMRSSSLAGRLDYLAILQPGMSLVIE
jgi:hypothetical protein